MTGMFPPTDGQMVGIVIVLALVALVVWEAVTAPILDTVDEQAEAALLEVDQ